MGWGTLEPSPLGSSLNAFRNRTINWSKYIYEVDIINPGTGYNVNSTPLSVTNGSGTNLYLEIITIGNNSQNAMDLKKYKSCVSRTKLSNWRTMWR